jgi:hypothetical protein
MIWTRVRRRQPFGPIGDEIPAISRDICSRRQSEGADNGTYDPRFIERMHLSRPWAGFLALLPADRSVL